MNIQTENVSLDKVTLRLIHQFSNTGIVGELSFDIANEPVLKINLRIFSILNNTFKEVISILSDPKRVYTDVLNVRAFKILK